MIIAVDFDGILFENKFPLIGKPNYDMISFTRQLIDEGHEVILWTSRAGTKLNEAVSVCEDYGLHFCAINKNAPSNLNMYLSEYPIPSPKVYADIYIDDRDPWFIRYAQNHKDVTGTLIDHVRKSINKLENEMKKHETRSEDGEQG